MNNPNLLHSSSKASYDSDLSLKFAWRLVALFQACLLFPLSAHAMDIQFEQEIQQGAMLYGTTDAKSIRWGERVIDVDDKGRFVFGLGRDASPELKLTLTDADSKIEQVSFAVRQREYDTQSIEGVASKYVSPPDEVIRRIQNDTAQVKAARAVYSASRFNYLEDFQMPAEGRISGIYGSQRIFNGVPKRPHYGLDIAAPSGTPVLAPVSGVVTLVHEDMYYSGGTLIVDHGRGISSTFIHLSKLHVKVGDEIEKGQVIAEVGSSGRSTGPHLDWRINWFDQRLDPELVLPERD